MILRLFLCLGLGITGALRVLKPRMFDQYWEPRLAEFRPKTGGERQGVRNHVPISFFIYLISVLGLIAVALAGFLSWARSFAENTVFLLSSSWVRTMIRFTLAIALLSSSLAAAPTFSKDVAPIFYPTLRGMPSP